MENTSKEILLSDLRVIYDFFNASSNDKTRQNLCGVYHYDNNIFSTDGHIAVKKFTCVKGNYFFSIESKNDLKSFLKTYKKMLPDISFAIKEDQNGLFIESNLDSYTRLYFKKDQGHAPNYFKMIQWDLNSKEKTDIIGLNPELLYKIHKAMNIPSIIGLKIKINDKYDPIIVKSLDQKFSDYTACIMPMRVN